MRVLVTGSRDYRRYFAVRAILDGLKSIYGDNLFVIEGGAKGADALAKRWYEENDVPHKQFPADWNKYGKAAGAIRNQQMLDEAHPEIVFAFKDDFNWKMDKGGTEDMCKRAKEALVPTFVIQKV